MNERKLTNAKRAELRRAWAQGCIADLYRSPAYDIDPGTQRAWLRVVLWLGSKINPEWRTEWERRKREEMRL